jgi:TatD DNase family protein
MQLIDTHCHLDDRKFSSDLPEVLDASIAAGVVEFVTIGCDLESSRKSIELAHEHPEVWAAVGVHPHDASTVDADMLRKIATLAADPRVVAVGETGLDYFRDLSPRAAQRQAFADFIKLATDLGKPLIVHSRDADDEVLEILADTMADGQRVVRHCFAGGPETMQAYIDLGCYVGITATVTYPKCDDQRAAVASADLGHLVLETDCPYLPPQSRRGERNDPSLIPETLQVVAECMDKRPDFVAQATTANARALYRLRG